MTNPQHHPDKDIDREQLIRELLDEMDKAVRETGQFIDHAALLRKLQETKTHTPIYRILNQENFDMINASDDPFQAQFDTLTMLLPQLLDKLYADAIFLLRGSHTNDYSTLELESFYQSDPLMQPSVNANMQFALSEGAWKTMGNYKGVEISVYLPTSNGAPPPYQLPLPDYDAEIVFVRVGKYESRAKFLLVIHKTLDVQSNTPTYSKDLHDLFDLLIVRLQELHNLTLHRNEEIEYDNKRTEFMQDVLHQIRNSVGGLLEQVEFLLKKNKTATLHHELDSLYKAIRVLSDAAESSYLATEKRSIFEVYPEDPRRMSGSDWVKLLTDYSEIFHGEVKGRGLHGIYIDEANIQQFPIVEAVVPLIRLVVFNLLQNALKYSQRNAKTAITVDGYIDDGFIKIVFTNYGIGLDYDEKQRIFERHYRSRLVKENHRTGTGIGLYLCRSIMKQHGGDIHLESMKYNSDHPNLMEISFAISFPIVEDYTELDVEEPEDDRPTILYVEDEYYIHRYSIRLLEERFKVLHAYTGRQALEYLLEDRETGKYNIRLILLDITLNDDNDKRFSGVRGGVELAKVILKDEEFDLPIIGWTGNLMPPMIKELNSLGVKRVIGRTSISIDQLSDLIETMIK